ncbi:hypothetical protein [Tenacibaculum sp. nBUS_03]|uniref:hypothetical protein n=1 Tax=Tenacibaculum sp. nBUS_03 TaxID=3395320 RepID=UPI003EC0C571
MVSILIAIIFLGCSLLYNTSKNTTVLLNNNFGQKLRNNQKLSKILGSSFLVISLVLTSMYLGITVGILFWLITLMLLMSLLTLIFPLKLISYKFIVALFLVLLLIEFVL